MGRNRLVGRGDASEDACAPVRLARYSLLCPREVRLLSPDRVLRMAAHLDTDCPALAVVSPVRRIVANHITAIDIVQHACVDLISLAGILQEFGKRARMLRQIDQSLLPPKPPVSVTNKEFIRRTRTDGSSSRYRDVSYPHYFPGGVLTVFPIDSGSSEDLSLGHINV